MTVSQPKKIALKELVPESKKVTNFLARIPNSSLGNGLSFIYKNPNLLTNFDACQKCLLAIAAASICIHQMMQNNKNRNVLAVVESWQQETDGLYTKGIHAQGREPKGTAFVLGRGYQEMVY